MTTTVTVSACCDSKTTKVEVKVLDGTLDEEHTYLEDGESIDFHAYDGRKIVVSEIPK